MRVTATNYSLLLPVVLGPSCPDQYSNNTSNDTDSESPTPDSNDTMSLEEGDDYSTIYSNESITEPSPVLPLARYCDRDPPEWWLKMYVEAETGLSFALLYLVPMLLIAVFYGLTAQALMSSAMLESGGSADRMRRKREQAAR